MNRRVNRLHHDLAAAAAHLRAAGVPSPEHDARVLAAHSLGLEPRELWRADAVGPDFADLVRRRAARVPLQHLTGRAYFRHVELAVGPGVFVPRPETELVAQAAIDAAAPLDAPVVVDLCTGSGAIALAVADEVPRAHVYAVELSADAHAWAARNCAGTPVELRLGDTADAFPELDGTVDVVVSNPPYIPAASVPLDPEVRDHDPPIALWSGEDGLETVRVVVRTAARLLRAGGLAVVEHADSQGDAVPALFAAAAGWRDVRDHADLTGRPRFTTARLDRPDGGHDR